MAGLKHGGAPMRLVGKRERCGLRTGSRRTQTERGRQRGNSCYAGKAESHVMSPCGLVRNRFGSESVQALRRMKSSTGPLRGHQQIINRQSIALIDFVRGHQLKAIKAPATKCVLVNHIG